LPRYLFATALAAQLFALAVRLPALTDIAHALLGMAVLVGLIALTALLIDYTTAPVGSVAHRLRGRASAHSSVLVVGYTLAWYVHADATAWAVFAIEVLSFAGGAAAYWDAWRQAPSPEDADETVDGWPFTSRGDATVLPRR
jgi:hypothetical protein